MCVSVLILIKTKKELILKLGVFSCLQNTYLHIYIYCKLQNAHAITGFAILQLKNVSCYVIFICG